MKQKPVIGLVGLRDFCPSDLKCHCHCPSFSQQLSAYSSGKKLLIFTVRYPGFKSQSSEDNIEVTNGWKDKDTVGI